MRMPTAGLPVTVSRTWVESRPMASRPSAAEEPVETQARDDEHLLQPGRELGVRVVAEPALELAEDAFLRVLAARR